MQGNIILTGHGAFHCDDQGPNSCQGPIFELSGSGDQTIRGLDPSLVQVNPANAGLLSNAPSIGINKTSGRSFMTGVVGIRRDFIVRNIAAYDFSASKLVFDATDCARSTFTAGPATEYNDIYEMMSSCSGI